MRAANGLNPAAIKPRMTSCPRRGMRGDYAHGRRGAGGAIVEVERASHDATQHSPVVPVVSYRLELYSRRTSADFLLPCEGGSRFAILAAREQKSADTG